MDYQVPVRPPRLLDFSCQVFSKAPATDPGNTTTSCLLQLKVSTRCDHLAPPPRKETKLIKKNNKNLPMWSLSPHHWCQVFQIRCDVSVHSDDQSEIFMSMGSSVLIFSISWMRKLLHICKFFWKNMHKQLLAFCCRLKYLCLQEVNLLWILTYIWQCTEGWHIRFVN